MLRGKQQEEDSERLSAQTTSGGGCDVMGTGQTGWLIGTGTWEDVSISGMPRGGMKIT